MIRCYDIGLYPAYLWVSTLEYFDKYKSRFYYYASIADMNNDNPGTPASPTNKGGVTFVVIEKKTKKKGILILIDVDIKGITDFDFDVVAHESVHGADAIYDFIGAYGEGYDRGNEPYAYLVGFIAGKIGQYMIDYIRDNKDENG